VAILFDTNILLRWTQKHHPHSATAVWALKALRSRNEELHIAPQNIVEFWAVATRPLNQNGLGMTIEQTTAEIESLKSFFGLLPELPLHEEWQRIVTQYRVSGKNVHDARLVAAMSVHGIGEILTFNGPDFARYTEISVLDPSQVI
jgi:predicted nucleic acid-binding protein